MYNGAGTDHGTRPLLKNMKKCHKKNCKLRNLLLLIYFSQLSLCFLAQVSEIQACLTPVSSSVLLTDVTKNEVSGHNVNARKNASVTPLIKYILLEYLLVCRQEILGQYKLRENIKNRFGFRF